MISMTIKGTKECADALNKKNQNVKDAVSATIMRAGFLVEAEAKRVVHVQTGRLKSSIHTTKIDEFAAMVSDNVEYGEYEEARGGEHAFMTIAKENKEDEVQKLISDAVKKAVNDGW